MNCSKQAKKGSKYISYSSRRRRTTN